MRTAEYANRFRLRKTVRIADGPRSILLLPPDPVDADIGPGRITADDAVELHRALTAWLSIHRRHHPNWHARRPDTTKELPE